MSARCLSDRSPLFHWLALERIPRVGPLTIARLYEGFKSPEAALHADFHQIRNVTGLSEKLARAITEYSIPDDAILKDMETLERLGARVITRWDPDYPLNLQEIYDPPALLFVRGSLVPGDRRAVAVVGTRNPTHYGIKMAEALTRDLVLAGVSVVSGLARGIDAVCHRTALKHSGRTIGVVGCGIDVVYPREHRELVEEMVDSGAVISEFRPGVPPLATNFYRRNRIVSGLVKGVVVVEAGRTSGSLITANHAAEQNREVFAVPGNVVNPRSAGPHLLLKQGAGLVESAQDVLKALFEPFRAPVQSSLFEKQQPRDELSDMGNNVLCALDPDPVPIDFLCETLGMDAGTLSAVLLELELNGLARQHPGKMFSRIIEPVSSRT
jgi:DNA processing protein